MLTVVLLAAGDPFHRHIGRLKSEGYMTIAVDRDPAAKGRNEADAFVAASITDVDAIVGTARKFDADVIVALTEAGVRSAAEASALLQLPGLPVDVAEAATDKSKMRARWLASGLNQPSFIVVNRLEDAREAVAQIGIPCVVKPTRAWSSRGVSVVSSAEGAESALRHAFDVHGGPIIVETFIPGRLLTAEGFASDGEAEVIAMGDVDTQESDRHRVNMSLQYPANFDRRVVEEANILIANAALSLGLRRSPFHCECMVSDQGVQLIEMAARGGGGHIFPVLYEPMVGYSGIVRQVALLLGKETEFARPPLRGGCYRFFSAPDGIIERVEGVDVASQMPGVLDLGVAIKPGERGGAVTHDNARHGHVCTVGSDRDAALAYAKAAERQLTFYVSEK